MALKLPGADDLSAPVSGRSGRPIASYDASAIGRGIAQAGQGMQALAAGLKMHDAQEKKKVDQASAFETQSRYLQFEEQQRKAFADAILSAPVGADGFSAQQADTYRKSAREFMKSVPDDLKPEYDQTLFKLETAITSKADTFAVQERDRVAQTKIADGQNIILQGLQDNPAAWRDADAQAEALVRNSGRTAIDQDMDLREWRKRRAEALWEVDSRTNGPEARERLGIAPADGGSGVDQFVNRIIRVESGGRADAKNPNSSATGPGQFIASTWLGMVKKYRPDLMAGRSAGEVLALRTDPSLSREMTRLYAQENANFLAAQGLAQTPGNIYLAHFLGPRGAAQVLKAAPGAPIESIVGADAVKANGFLSGKSASWVASWAEKKMGGAGGSVVAPEYADLPYEDRVKLYDTSLAQEKREQEAAAVQLRAQQAAFKDALALGIETGTVVSRQEILGANIGDGDKATLLKALEAKLKQDGGVAEAIAAFQAGTLRTDPYSADDRKTIDGVYSAFERSLPSEHLQSATDELIASSGIVPRKVHNAIRAGIESTVPSDVEAALLQADRIARINPAILGRGDGGSEIQKKADLFDVLTRSMGYSSADAAKRIAEQNDPEKARQRAALLASEPVKEMLKKVDDTTIAKAISGVSLLGWELGEHEAQRAGMVSEYKAILQETIVDANGNEAVAKELANKRFERLYGASDLMFTNRGWRNVVTRLPPEKVYEPLPDGSFDYIGNQLRETLAAEGVEFDDVWLAADEDTETFFQNGEPPRYRIVYEQNGEVQVYPLPFYADRAAALEAYDAEQQRLLDERRQQMEQNRAAELHRYPEGREGPERFSNDGLYFGVAREDSPMGRISRERMEQAEETRRRVAPLIEQDRQEREAFDALDPEAQRERGLDDYLDGPILPGRR